MAPDSLSRGLLPTAWAKVATLTGVSDGAGVTVGSGVAVGGMAVAVGCAVAVAGISVAVGTATSTATAGTATNASVAVGSGSPADGSSAATFAGASVGTIGAVGRVLRRESNVALPATNSTMPKVLNSTGIQRTLGRGAAAAAALCLTKARPLSNTIAEALSLVCCAKAPWMSACAASSGRVGDVANVAMALSFNTR